MGDNRQFQGLAEGQLTIRITADPGDIPELGDVVTFLWDLNLLYEATDPMVAAQHAFDRATGKPVTPDRLLTYRQALAQYHLHPERKFHGGDYLDAGPTSRRHIRPLGPINNIGKEANRWEEQVLLGADPGAQVDYGMSDAQLDQYAAEVRGRARGFGVREIGREASVSVGTVSGFLRGKTRPDLRIVRAIDRAGSRLGAVGAMYRGGRAEPGALRRKR